MYETLLHARVLHNLNLLVDAMIRQILLTYIFYFAVTCNNILTALLSTLH